MNYFFKTKEIYLRIFTKKYSIKQMNYLKNDYGHLKSTFNSTGLETGFSELKDLVALLDIIKNMKYQQKKPNINKKNLINT